MAGLCEGAADFVDVRVVTGLEFEAYGAAVDIRAGVDTLVCDGDDVAACRAYDAAHTGELAWLIGKVDDEGIVAAALAETACDDTAESVHVDITARNKTYHFLALDRQLAEHCGCHRNGTGTLGNKFLLLDKSENSCGDFVIGDGDNLVGLFVTHLEGIHTWFFHGDTVGNCMYVVEMTELAFFERCGH